VVFVVFQRFWGKEGGNWKSPLVRGSGKKTIEKSRKKIDGEGEWRSVREKLLGALRCAKDSARRKVSLQKGESPKKLSESEGASWKEKPERSGKKTR